jgi:hypothetical protein
MAKLYRSVLFRGGLRVLSKDRNRPKADIYPTSRLLSEIHGFDIVI